MTILNPNKKKIS